MSASIRGHSGDLKMFENGAPLGIIEFTNVDIQQNSDFQQTEYLGNPIPEGDQVMKGWTGTMDMEVKNNLPDKFIDALIVNNLNGIGVSDYSFVSTEKYADGTTSAWVYFDCQWKLSKNQKGLSSKMTKRFDFQCSGRLPL